MTGTVRTRWPWISLLLSAALVLNPVGLDLLHSAFFAGEQLARNIAQPIVLTAVATMAVVVGLEWLVRTLIARSRARGATG
jgi:NADH:ubiquinone oxidoreductase subunit K